MKRFAAASIGLSLVLAAACSQTSAGNPTERSPEPFIEERASESPAPGMSEDAGSEQVSDPATEQGPPRFEGGVFRIGPTLRDVLIGRNWTPGCPVAIHDLRVVNVSYWNFRGGVGTGPLVLHERVARDVLWVFQRLFRAKFRIQDDRARGEGPADHAEGLLEQEPSERDGIVQLSARDGQHHAVAAFLRLG